jgi:MoaA/NifB/PqqE/SkfB family radical SAM enzyme
MVRMVCNKEDIFTSIGEKFWRHRTQMESYKKGRGQTIVSTHISPEGSCNLQCKYCSVWKRNKNSRIPLNTIKDYILKLKTRGLHAVIITGGGEPVLYPEINELVSWLVNEKLLVGLITNGTLSSKIEVWDKFSWVRVSINQFPDWENRISIPREKMREEAILGASFIYTDENLEVIKAISVLSNKLNVKYIRVVPECLIDEWKRGEVYKKLSRLIYQVRDEKFFIQRKIKRYPRAKVCHQSYFRPYLSEVDGGTVYPCDSIVLNEGKGLFLQKYQICKAEDVLDFLDKRTSPHFDVQRDCKGCVFANTVDMLDDWVSGKVNRFNKFAEPILHEEFL